MRSATGRWRALAAVGAASVPPLLVARAVMRFGVNVPFWDEWMLTPIMVAGVRGELPATLLWAQHNEHRPVVANVVWWLLGGATHWNVRAILAANVVTALLTLVVLVLLVARTVRPSAPALVPWLVVASSLFVFSLAQWESWISGLQLTLFIGALGSTAAAWLVARWDGRWSGLAAILLAGFVSAFSFANGLVLLALIPFALLLMPDAGTWDARVRSALVAAVVGAIGISLYLTGWTHPASHPPVASALQHPAVYLLYVLVYLGSGLSLSRLDLAAGWGGVGLVTFAACTVYLSRRSRLPRATLVPWAMLGAYTVLAGCVTSIGRVSFGVEQALASRYVTMTASFWIVLVVLLAMCVVKMHGDHVQPFVRVGIAGLLLGALVLTGTAYTRSSREGWSRLAMRHDELSLDTECLLHFDRAPDECLLRLYPDAPLLRRWAGEMRELGLGPFAAAPEPSLESYSVVSGPAGFIDGVSLVDNPPFNQVNVSGWAMDPITRRAARQVLVSVDGDVVGRTVPSIRRRDVARVQGRPARDSGWQVRFGRYRVAAGAHRLEAYALLEDGRIAPLEGARTFTTDGDGAPR